MEDRHVRALSLARDANILGKHRLNAAIVQALLTVINLTISVVILFHVIQ